MEAGRKTTACAVTRRNAGALRAMHRREIKKYGLIIGCQDNPGWVGHHARDP
ncbi:hypothetical protein ACLOJK_027017 [Asimina triloba]